MRTPHPENPDAGQVALGMVDRYSDEVPIDQEIATTPGGVSQ